MVRETHYDVMVISNFNGWTKSSSSTGDNNDAFQINFTKRCVQKIHVDSIYINPRIDPNLEPRLWLDYLRYKDVKTPEFEQFLSNSRLHDQYAQKKIKLTDFKFTNLSRPFESMVKIGNPKRPQPILKITPQSPAVNLIYLRNRDLFQRYINKGEKPPFRPLLNPI
jgi:hypothetical protein